MQREDTSKVAIKKSASDEDRSAEEVDVRSLRAQLSPVFFLTVIFSLNFVSRIILSPLLPTIEKELGISHSQAGFFFFLSSGGYLVGLLSSGLFTSRSTHRLAIVVSIAGIGVAMLAIAAASAFFSGKMLISARAAGTMSKSLMRASRSSIDFFGADGHQSSELVAREGELYQRTRDMIARGNVVLLTTEGWRMTTEELHFSNSLRRISSDQLVRVEKEGSVLEGVGFESDPNLEHFEFQHEVRATVRPGAAQIVPPVGLHKRAATYGPALPGGQH